MKKSILLIFSFVCFHQSTIAQQFTGKAAQDDITFCYNALRDLHPSVNRYTSEKELSNLHKLFMLQFNKDSVSRNELGEALNNMASSLRCVHTSFSKSMKAMSTKKFDMAFIIFNGDLYARKIKELGADTSLYRILNIDGVSSNIIVNRLMALRSGDGYGMQFSEQVIAKNFNAFYNLFYQPADVCSMTVQNAKGVQEITVRRVEQQKQNYPIYNWEKESLLDTMVGAKLYKLKEQSDLRVLRILKFDSKFKTYYKTIFEQMAQDSVKRLVIDLRDNGGGNIYHCYELLSYVLQQDLSFYAHRKKNKAFPYLSSKGKMQYVLGRVLYDVLPTGKRWSNDTTWKHYRYDFKKVKYDYKFEEVIVITNGYSVSSASLVAGYLKYYGGARVIGQETGGAYVGNNGRAFPEVVMPNSKAVLRLPLYYIEYFPGVPNQGTGVPVDTEISILLNRDDQKKAIFKELSK